MWDPEDIWATSPTELLALFYAFINVLLLNRAIGLMSRVFTNGPENGVQSQVESYQRLKNGTWCRIALHYSALYGTDEGQNRAIRRMELRLPLHVGIVAIEKTAFGSPSTTITSLLLRGLFFFFLYLIGSWWGVPATPTSYGQKQPN